MKPNLLTQIVAVLLILSLAGHPVVAAVAAYTLDAGGIHNRVEQRVESSLFMHEALMSRMISSIHQKGWKPPFRIWTDALPRFRASKPRTEILLVILKATGLGSVAGIVLGLIAGIPDNIERALNLSQKNPALLDQYVGTGLTAAVFLMSIGMLAHILLVMHSPENRKSGKWLTGIAASILGLAALVGLAVLLNPVQNNLFRFDSGAPHVSSPEIPENMNDFDPFATPPDGGDIKKPVAPPAGTATGGFVGWVFVALYGWLMKPHWFAKTGVKLETIQLYVAPIVQGLLFQGVVAATVIYQIYNGSYTGASLWGVVATLVSAAIYASPFTHPLVYHGTNPNPDDVIDEDRWTLFKRALWENALFLIPAVIYLLVAQQIDGGWENVLAAKYPATVLQLLWEPIASWSMILLWPFAVRLHHLSNKTARVSGKVVGTAALAEGGHGQIFQFGPVKPKEFGHLFIISSQSGAGATTLINYLLAERSDIKRQPTYTTRRMRTGETEGQDYYFVSKERFEELQAEGMLFAPTLYDGCWYGIPTDVIARINLGESLVMQAEVGALSAIRERIAGLTAFLITAPLVQRRQALESRLAGEAGDIEWRLQEGERELSQADKFDHHLINIGDDASREVLIARISDVLPSPAVSTGSHAVDHGIETPPGWPTEPKRLNRRVRVTDDAFEMFRAVFAYVENSLRRSDRALARAAGMHEGYLNHIKNGRSPLRWDSFFRIMESMRQLRAETITSAEKLLRAS